MLIKRNLLKYWVKAGKQVTWKEKSRVPWSKQVLDKNFLIVLISIKV